LNVQVQSGLGVTVRGYVNIYSGTGPIFVDILSGASNTLSGLNILLQSGQSVALLSGEVTRWSGLNIAGNLSVAVSISGQPVALVSGTNITLSGLGIIVSFSGQSISAPSSAPVYITNSRSSPIYVASGVVVVATVSVGSGLYIINDSGVYVRVESGSFIQIQSGVGVIIQSGVHTQTTFTPSVGVRTRSLLRVTSDSGGITLLSGDIHSVTIKNLSGDIYVGGSQGIDYPYNGYGMILCNGEALTLDVNNFNLISVCAVNSGDLISYIGII
jgi:hypothetical protein